jgi:hypothetical protein
MKSVYRCQHLTGLKLKIFLSVADCIIPPTPDSPGGGSMITAGMADWALAHLQPSLRKQLLFLLYALEFLGIVFGGSLFTSNSKNTKIRELRWLENNPICRLRLGFFGIKNFICMGYYTREDVWKSIGYTGPIEPDKPYADNTIRSLSQQTIEVVE